LTSAKWVPHLLDIGPNEARLKGVGYLLVTLHAITEEKGIFATFRVLRRVMKTSGCRMSFHGDRSSQTMSLTLKSKKSLAGTAFIVMIE
jgi:hypothetical protein